MSSNDLSRLLHRQVRKFIPPELVGPLTPFLAQVDDCYRHYESDRNLMNRAMEISSQELLALNSELKRSNELLENFNYAATHDLKNHALNIESMVSLLGKYQDGDREKQAAVIAHLEMASEQLKKALYGFIEASKISFHGMHSQPLVSEVELQGHVEADCAYWIGSFNAMVEWDHQGANHTYPEQVTRSILSNLVSNGIKYKHPERDPVIGIALRAMEDRVSIEVRDNGSGMDLQKYPDQIFKLFSRLPNSREVEGTGIGLYLVKQYVDMLNGSIEVNSTPMVGTTFRITLMNT